MRQRRVAEGKGLGTGLSTTAKYVRRTASGTASNDLGTAAKYLRRKRNDAAGNRLAVTIKYQRGRQELSVTNFGGQFTKKLMPESDTYSRFREFPG